MTSRHRIIAVVAATVVAATSGWAWYSASQARSPAQRAELAAPPSPSVVTAPVAAGPIVDSITLDGSLTRETVRTVSGPQAQAGTVRQVVTAVPIAVGEQVGIGDVLVEVSGRPLILLPGDFPAYRQLVRGDTGPDVRQLQTALRQLYDTPVNGRLDARTETDVRRLYSAAGYPPPVADQPAPPSTPPVTTPPADPPPPTLLLPADELVFLPDVPAIVGALPARVGDIGSGPLVSLTSGGWQLAVPLGPDLDALVAGLPAGAQFRLDGPGGALLAAPEIRNPAASAEPGQQAAPEEAPAADTHNDGRTAVFALADQPDGARLGQGRQVLLERGRSPDDAPVVPASALWTATDGTVSVSVADGAGVTQLAVEVLLSVGGRAAVRPVTGQLLVGAQVVVATRDARPRSD
ncbi:peptidoglycan-binding domain-containing protein [Micromonospora sp. LOL_023]|uniref:peptidoglycan-binding domain-containing protein n=1 Tax=Micromonospora sp. LOL_023 TaxID=3345418 RepID=UPI003A8AB29A